MYASFQSSDSQGISNFDPVFLVHAFRTIPASFESPVEAVRLNSDGPLSSHRSGTYSATQEIRATTAPDCLDTVSGRSLLQTELEKNFHCCTSLSISLFGDKWV
jgi:hypothetical protein